MSSIIDDHPLFVSMVILLGCELTYMYIPEIMDPPTLVAMLHHVFGVLKALDNVRV